MGKRWFGLEAAQEAERELRRLLAPVCGRIEVVGSVRRERPRVGDLDLLLRPKIRTLTEYVVSLGFDEYVHVRTVEQSAPEGPAKIRLVHVATGVPVDLHISPSMETWWTQLVVLTGSKRFIAKVRRSAWTKHRKKLNPEGIAWQSGEVKHPRSERAVFQSCGHPFVRAQERS